MPQVSMGDSFDSVNERQIKETEKKTKKTKEKPEASRMPDVYGSPTAPTVSDITPPEPKKEPTKSDLTIGNLGEEDELEVAFREVGGAFDTDKQSPEEKAKTQKNIRDFYDTKLNELSKQDTSTTGGLVGSAASGGLLGGVVGAIAAAAAKIYGNISENDARRLEVSDVIKGLERNGATQEEIDKKLKEFNISRDDYNKSNEEIKQIRAEAAKKGIPINDKTQPVDRTSRSRETDPTTTPVVTVGDVAQAPTPETVPTVQDDEYARMSGLINYLNQKAYERDVELANLRQHYGQNIANIGQKYGLDVKAPQARVIPKPQQVTVTPNAWTVADIPSQQPEGTFSAVPQFYPDGSPMPVSGAVYDTPAVPAVSSAPTQIPEDTLKNLAANPNTNWETASVIYGVPVDELKRRAGITPQQPFTMFTQPAPTSTNNKLGRIEV